MWARSFVVTSRKQFGAFSYVADGWLDEQGIEVNRYTLGFPRLYFQYSTAGCLNDQKWMRCRGYNFLMFMGRHYTLILPWFAQD